MVKEISGTDHLDAVLDETHAIWGEGLSRRAYGAWNRAQELTPWGQQHLARVGLERDGAIVASAKRYLFDAVMAGKPVKVLGIGAVFTAEPLRGEGLAATLVESMCEDARAKGCEVALMFSEIGTDYYAGLGFEAIARTCLTIDVPRNRLGAPATLVRAAEPADYPLLAEMSMQYASADGFALTRTAEFVEFGVARRRLLAGLGPANHRSIEFFVSEEGHRAVAYVLISRGPDGVWLHECGDRDPAGARVGAILEVLAAREPSHQDRTLKTWWPADFRPPQIRVVDEFPAPQVMMARSLNGDAVSFAPATYWQTDVF